MPAADATGSPSPSLDADTSLLGDVIAQARKAGADSADAVLLRGQSLSTALRLKEPEKTEREEGNDLGLRVFIGHRQAIVSSTDFRPPALAELVERAVAMAKSVPEDPYCGLAKAAEIAQDFPDPASLDLVDPGEPAPELLVERARQAEEAALSVPGITNSEGAEASWSRSSIVLAASNGFSGAYEISRFGLAVSVLAGTGTEMERDHEFCSTIYDSDLESPEALGREAAERAVRRLNPRKMKTVSAPVVFDSKIAGSLLGHLASAINGAAVARGTSFLRDRLGQPVMAESLTVIDDPHRPRGLRSKPFDGEGLPNRRQALVDKGVLQSWVLDLRSARQLGLSSTGHAGRGTSSPPAPTTTNLYLEPGQISPEELIAGIQNGLFVTDLMGFGVNGITGDYSRGARGFWIENGAIAFPVNELTIAGNLKDMFLNIIAANDLRFRYATNAPTLRIDGMTIAGA